VFVFFEYLFSFLSITTPNERKEDTVEEHIRILDAILGGGLRLRERFLIIL